MTLGFEFQLPFTIEGKGGRGAYRTLKRVQDFTIYTRAEANDELKVRTVH
jgi:hypothetical protein